MDIIDEVTTEKEAEEIKNDDFSNDMYDPW